MEFVIENGVLKKCILKEDEHKVVIPEGVVTIGDEAFEDCFNLTNIELPKSVTGIGNNAFRHCDALTICEDYYLQEHSLPSIVSRYYDLFNKYRSDYQVGRILEGTEDASIVERAKKAKFDERLSVLGLLLDGIAGKLQDVIHSEEILFALKDSLKRVRGKLDKSEVSALLGNEITLLENKKTSGKASGSLSVEEERKLTNLIKILQSMLSSVNHMSDGAKAFQVLKKEFDDRKKALENEVGDTGASLSNMFTFCEKAFGDGQEMLILVTELTVSYYGVRFISHYGCKEYYRHNKELLFYERRQKIIDEMERLDWED